MRYSKYRRKKNRNSIPKLKRRKTVENETDELDYESLDPEERDEMDKLIRQYLKDNPQNEFAYGVDNYDDWEWEKADAGTVFPGGTVSSTSSTSSAINPTTGKPYYAGGGTWTKYCTHKPTLMIDDEELKIWVGRRFDIVDDLSKFPIAVNLTGDSVRMNHKFGPFRSLEKYNSKYKFKEIVLDWPDYGVVYFPLEFWLDLVEIIKTNGKEAIFFCVGGHGRTGTALAAMMVAYLGWDGWDAIRWIRRYYCDDAIESKEQESYIIRLGEAYEKKFQTKLHHPDIEPWPITPEKPAEKKFFPELETKPVEPKPDKPRLTEDEAHEKASKMWEGGFAYVDLTAKYCVVDDGETSFTGGTFEMAFDRAEAFHAGRKPGVDGVKPMTASEANTEAAIRYGNGYAWLIKDPNKCCVRSVPAQLTGVGDTFEEAFADLEGQIAGTVR
jgi:hypothetical protein